MMLEFKTLSEALLDYRIAYFENNALDIYGLENTPIKEAISPYIHKVNKILVVERLKESRARNGKYWRKYYYELQQIYEYFDSRKTVFYDDGGFNNSILLSYKIARKFKQQLFIRGLENLLTIYASKSDIYWKNVAKYSRIKYRDSDRLLDLPIGEVKEYLDKMLKRAKCHPNPNKIFLN